MSRWQPLWQTFPGDAGEVIRELMPELLVDAEQIKNKPVPGDPLGCKARLQVRWEFEYLNYRMLFIFELDGQRSPVLDHHAMQVWVCVQWPHAFRREP